jgi:hypothetical protein
MRFVPPRDLSHHVAEGGTAKLVLHFIQRPPGNTAETCEVAVFATEAFADLSADRIDCVIDCDRSLKSPAKIFRVAKA